MQSGSWWVWCPWEWSMCVLEPSLESSLLVARTRRRSCHWFSEVFKLKSIWANQCLYWHLCKLWKISMSCVKWWNRIIDLRYPSGTSRDFSMSFCSTKSYGTTRPSSCTSISMDSLWSPILKVCGKMPSVVGLTPTQDFTSIFSSTKIYWWLLRAS